jgi:hypothetical protein
MIILIIDINGKISREILNWQMENMVLKKKLSPNECNSKVCWIQWSLLIDMQTVGWKDFIFGLEVYLVVQGPHHGDPPANSPQTKKPLGATVFKQVSLSYSSLTGPWKNIVMRKCIRISSSTSFCTDFISADHNEMIAMSVKWWCHGCQECYGFTK